MDPIHLTNRTIMKPLKILRLKLYYPEGKTYPALCAASFLTFPVCKDSLYIDSQCKLTIYETRYAMLFKNLKH